jgi:hypothetical protein
MRSFANKINTQESFFYNFEPQNIFPKAFSGNSFSVALNSWIKSERCACCGHLHENFKWFSYHENTEILSLLKASEHFSNYHLQQHTFTDNPDLCNVVLFKQAVDTLYGKIRLSASCYAYLTTKNSTPPWSLANNNTLISLPNTLADLRRTEVQIVSPLLATYTLLTLKYNSTVINTTLSSHVYCYVNDKIPLYEFPHNISQIKCFNVTVVGQFSSELQAKLNASYSVRPEKSIALHALNLALGHTGVTKLAHPKVFNMIRAVSDGSFPSKIDYNKTIYSHLPEDDGEFTHTSYSAGCEPTFKAYENVGKIPCDSDIGLSTLPLEDFKHNSGTFNHLTKDTISLLEQQESKLVYHRSSKRNYSFTLDDLPDLFPDIFIDSCHSYSHTRPTRISRLDWVNALLLGPMGPTLESHHSFLAVVFHILLSHHTNHAIFTVVRYKKHIPIDAANIAFDQIRRFFDHKLICQQNREVNLPAPKVPEDLKKINSVVSSVEDALRFYPCSPQEMKQYRRLLMGMPLLGYGLPAIFFSISPKPDRTYSVIIRSRDPETQYIDLEEYINKISATKLDRQHNAGTHPYSTATFFLKMKELLLEEVFGIHISKLGWNTTKNEAKPEGGIFGILRNYFCRGEEHRDKMMHMHWIIFVAGFPKSHQQQSKWLECAKYQIDITAWINNLRSYNSPILAQYQGQCPDCSAKLNSVKPTIECYKRCSPTKGAPVVARCPHCLKTYSSLQLNMAYIDIYAKAHGISQQDYMQDIVTHEACSVREYNTDDPLQLILITLAILVVQGLPNLISRAFLLAL